LKNTFDGEFMNNKGKDRKCPYCQDFFSPGNYNAHVQEFCRLNSECKKAASRASSKKCREKKRNDLSWKKSECERVKGWQKKSQSFTPQ